MTESTPGKGNGENHPSDEPTQYLDGYTPEDVRADLDSAELTAAWQESPFGAMGYDIEVTEDTDPDKPLN